ncbi:MAG: substrate-binding domain-containing protein [Actinomycetes bacterium]|jgi:phosphate transport system substrate-binding protein|nr:substrate-binding domain-containing protein [Actinomycetes bacterium]
MNSVGKTILIAVSIAAALVLAVWDVALRVPGGAVNSSRQTGTGSYSEDDPVFLEPVRSGLASQFSFQLGQRRVEEVQYRRQYGSYPCLDGSTVMIPMIRAFARELLGFSGEDAEEFSYVSTTDGAYKMLISGDSSEAGLLDGEAGTVMEAHVTDLFLGTKPSADVEKQAKTRGVELVKKPVCWDAFIFITHKDNPVDSLTLDQIRAIYSGTITNWKEVGGRDEAITAYQRQEGSGSQTGMEQLVMQGRTMIEPETTEVPLDMSGLLKVVSEYKNKANSLGYTYRYYLEHYGDNFEQEPISDVDNLKILRVEDSAPTTEAIQLKTYPLAVNYYGVIRADDCEKTGGKFLDWMRTEAGQSVVAQAGYIPLADPKPQEDGTRGEIPTFRLGASEAIPVSYSQDFGSYPNIESMWSGRELSRAFAQNFLGKESLDWDYFVVGYLDGDIPDAAFYPFLRRLKTQFDYSKSYYESPSDVSGGKEELNIYLDDDVVDMLLRPRPDGDDLRAIKQSGARIFGQPVYQDAVVFVVPDDSPVTYLSSEQLRDLLLGKVTNWKQLGGPEQDIEVWLGPKNSPEKRFITEVLSNALNQKIVLKNHPENAELSDDDDYEETLFEFYEAELYPAGSIGISYLQDYRYEEPDDLRILTIDGVEPDAQTIRDGSYPFIQTFYGLIHDEDKDSRGGRFLQWMLSPAGQRVVEDAGYVPAASAK